MTQGDQTEPELEPKACARLIDQTLGIAGGLTWTLPSQKYLTSDPPLTPVYKVDWVGSGEGGSIFVSSAASALNIALGEWGNQKPEVSCFAG